MTIGFRYQARETPINLPITNVTRAAARPNSTCLNPEENTDLPVKTVIAAPIRNSPEAPAIALQMIACIPDIQKNGMTGIL